MQAQELNPGDVVATKSIARLQPIVAERQEKMKDEMLGEVCYVQLLAVQSGLQDAFKSVCALHF